MKINHYNQAMKWITRPKEKPMPIVKYIDTMNRLYGSSGGEVKGTPEQVKGYLDQINNPKKTSPVSKIVKEEERFNDKILKRDKYETPKKKIIKKTLIVEKPKPKYLNGNVIDITPLIDDEWWKILDIEPPKEEEVLLRVPKRKLKGLASLLNVG